MSTPDKGKDCKLLLPTHPKVLHKNLYCGFTLETITMKWFLQLHHPSQHLLILVSLHFHVSNMKVHADTMMPANHILTEF